MNQSKLRKALARGGPPERELESDDPVGSFFGLLVGAILKDALTRPAPTPPGWLMKDSKALPPKAAVDATGWPFVYPEWVSQPGHFEAMGGQSRPAFAKVHRAPRKLRERAVDAEYEVVP